MAVKMTIFGCFFYYFHIFAQNIDCGYTLKPPHCPVLCSGTELYCLFCILSFTHLFWTGQVLSWWPKYWRLKRLRGFGLYDSTGIMQKALSIWSYLLLLQPTYCLNFLYVSPSCNHSHPKDMKKERICSAEFVEGWYAATKAILSLQCLNIFKQLKNFLSNINM